MKPQGKLQNLVEVLIRPQSRILEDYRRFPAEGQVLGPVHIGDVFSPIEYIAAGRDQKPGGQFKDRTLSAPGRTRKGGGLSFFKPEGNISDYRFVLGRKRNIFHLNYRFRHSHTFPVQLKAV
jgi:hypothetical protein